MANQKKKNPKQNKKQTNKQKGSEHRTQIQRETNTYFGGGPKALLK